MPTNHFRPGVSPASAMPTYPGSVLTVGSRGESVRQLQKCLNSIAGRYVQIPKLAEDGIYGNATRSAVLIFQRMFGLSQAGMVGAGTWNKIMQQCAAAGGLQPGYPGYILRVGATGEGVLNLQRYLNDISGKYPSLSIPRLAEDGIFGNGTKNAVIAFQRQFALAPDGLVGSLTWNKLMEISDSAPDGGNDGANGGSPGDGGSPPAIGTGELTADERETLNLINRQRANNGLQPLKIDPEVQRVAQIKAQDMVDNHYFSHNSPKYGTPFQMLASFGVGYRSAAENIAGNPSNSGAVNAWMNSQGHRTNILNGAYDYTGIGVVNDPRYGKTYAQIFIQK